MTNLNNNNTLFKRAQEMAKGKDGNELKQIAQNICKEKGIDYQSALEQFKQFSSMFNRK